MIIFLALIAVPVLLALAAQLWGVDSRDYDVDPRDHAVLSPR